MTTFLEHLIKVTDKEVDIMFTPVARYYPDMDFLLYVKEDCSYRAERVDAFLSILWHPHDERLIGIKLKGFKFIFERLRSVLDLKDAQFIPLVKALEVALVGGVGELLVDELERTKRQSLNERYAQAREIAAGVQFSPRELLLAA